MVCQYIEVAGHIAVLTITDVIDLIGTTVQCRSEEYLCQVVFMYPVGFGRELRL